jgi:hypothetical protein
MFFTQFPELQEADISCPVIAGDATNGLTEEASQLGSTAAEEFLKFTLSNNTKRGSTQ